LLLRCCSRVASFGPLLVLALLVPAGAQSSVNDTTPAAAATPVDGDRAEVATIVMQSVSEVKLCSLAVEKSQNTDVRSLCRKAASDSARTALAGMQLAQTLRAPEVKFQSSPGTPAVLDFLGQYSGDEFDRQFLLMQIQNGAGDEQDIRYAAEVAADRSIKSYEKDVLPKLEDRVMLAEGALRKLS
jgi:predicted outer membrane protein